MPGASMLPVDGVLIAVPDSSRIKPNNSPAEFDRHSPTPYLIVLY